MQDNVSNSNALGGSFDPDIFRRENRIHVKHGSVFTQDHYIVAHPRELTKENEPRMTAKLMKHYTVPNPSFFSFQPRGKVATQLATLVPISHKAKEETLAKKMLDLYTEEKTGVDTEMAKYLSRRESPFDSMVRNSLEGPKQEPDELEYQQNAMTLYLMLNEALSMHGMHKEASSYVRKSTDVDGILAHLCPLINITPNEFVETLGEGGLDALAERLNIKPQKLADIKEVAAMARENDFSNNLVENWNIGRAVKGAQTRSVADKMQLGLAQRVENKLKALRKEAANLDVPENIKQTERMLVSTIRDLPPELSESLYVSGTEFAYTPDPSVGVLDNHSGRALGFYRPASYDHSNEYGVRQIYVSARQSNREFRENFFHECHHLLFPREFTVEQRETIDGYLKSGATYMKELKTLVDAWYDSEPANRDQVKAAIDQKFFRPHGMKLDDVLGQTSMDSFRDAVHDAATNLDPDSTYLSKANYAMPELRVSEIISRYAEMKYVRMNDNPALLDVITPQMSAIYNDIYLPHLRARLDIMKSEQQDLSAHLQNLGVPPDVLRGAQDLQRESATDQPKARINSDSVAATSKGLQVSMKPKEMPQGKHAALLQESLDMSADQQHAIT